eukprot:Nitzschia sp. Nitz4//scaffold399_size11037//1658//3136//NITZ4_009050-RA/size11037-processed-gene-0.0-mRNA-1//1//CDS//3329550319//7098//frame0
MTEVRDSLLTGGAQGLFASKDYAKGERIMEEAPLIALAPRSDDEDSAILDKWFPSKSKGNDSSKPSLKETIQVPPHVQKSSQPVFRGMVQSGICWLEREKELGDDVSKLVDLYHPNQGNLSSTEKLIWDLSEEAIAYIQEQNPSSTSGDEKKWNTMRNVMLVWACNAFEGGRIYPKLSRVNHSCNPNAVIQTQHAEDSHDQQCIVAASDISKGDEITISYLGLLIYAEPRIRKEKLLQTKYFECQCSRCSKPLEDATTLIPCPTCHPRELPHQSLEEDVQYDDDQTVQYVSMGLQCSKCGSKAQNDKLQKIMDNVLQKVVVTLDEQQARKAPSNNEEEDDEDAALEEQIGLAGSIMGDRHWTTNVLKLLLLDHRLSTMSQAMLTTQELPEMDEIAEAIDMLQRIERFVGSVNLSMDPGHILADVIIGIARTLVSLGDVKSQKYAAEWLEKISDYVSKFESEGRQKVVAALRDAWKKHEDTKVQPPSKKAKRS